jgi:hypothetical protein
MAGSRHPHSKVVHLPQLAPGGRPPPAATHPDPIATAPAEVPILSTSSSGPRLMLAGKEAMAAVAKILAQAIAIDVPSAMGTVRLNPGSIWRGNRMLLNPAPLYVWYTIDDRLYEWNTALFVRDEWFSAMSEGAASAHWLVILGEAEMALLVGIFVPWYIMLGVSCAKLGIFYLTHKQAVNDAFKYSPEVIRALLALRESHPVLFHKLMVQAGKDVLSNLPGSVSAEDVAFFLGRVIKGALEAAPELTLRGLLDIAIHVAKLVAVVHLPSVTARAVGAAASTYADQLKSQMEAAGFTLTKGEAESILSEALAQPDTSSKLKALEDACNKLKPSTEVIGRALTGSP